jgi:nicotinate-nucleotide pyrophosphorylase (carboxylating)
MISPDMLTQSIYENVQQALLEDIGSGDLTAQLIPNTRQATAHILTREAMILAGTPWVYEIIRQIDPTIIASFSKAEGELISPNEVFIRLSGGARNLLTAERSILNFIQLLSGVATKVHHLKKQLDGTSAQLLDTRKTIPGLRVAQKYAVTIGGGRNHRIGLYDAFLIKENHIIACGGIPEAIAAARLISDRPIEIEVENIEEFKVALSARPDIIMLDNMSLDDMRLAVDLNQKQVKLEASGGVNEQTLRGIALTGVDYISMGTITKDVQAIDLSMRLVEQ